MRLVVGEDSVLFREGLVRLLADAGHQVLAAVGDADSMQARVRELRPDVVIADIRMPPRLNPTEPAQPPASARPIPKSASCFCPNTSSCANAST